MVEVSGIGKAAAESYLSHRDIWVVGQQPAGMLQASAHDVLGRRIARQGLNLTPEG